MRPLLVLFALSLAPLSASAQQEPPTGACRVVVGAPDVNAAGELVRPTPTDAQCARAVDLEERFIATSPREFRLVRNMGRLPDPVRAYIAGIDGLDGRRSPVNVQVGRVTQDLSPLEIWLGTELVVMAYRIADFGGATTTVVLADLDSFTVCAYLRWSGGALPAALSVEQIQDALDQGRFAERDLPACNLGSLPLD
jgi:hypothetical protein